MKDAVDDMFSGAKSTMETILEDLEAKLFEVKHLIEDEKSPECRNAVAVVNELIQSLYD